MKPPSLGGGLEGGSFWRTSHPIYTFGKRQGSVRLDLNEEARFVQLVDKGLSELQGWFATRNDDVTGLLATRLLDNRVLAHLPECLMAGVAEGTLQVASGQAKEEGRRACKESFTLQRNESLVNPHPLRRLPCCPQSPAHLRDSTRGAGRKSTWRCSRPWGCREAPR